ncbi:phosphoglycerate mutase [Ruminiclostridium sufflavum DSM 19573]|uniref:Phosphoglycerate mutase n=1 Tax=Ruminiclostridium sufflavum DSM 19573 TaxID=1121337 RepID=A0A318XMW2_9FIRM|nr:peptidase [Ruminiclostridium sufflavum]PYG89207.1 phosphoglycerate mutase [Ruminiclostridium sufflavum DSM 19573]
MKVVFVFIDGVGRGNKNKETNPIYATKTLTLARLIDEAAFYADAALGVEGLPQSATGQTSIFTGINAPAVLNRHMSGQPTATLREIIYRTNIFGELIKMGLKVDSSNVYREEYLARMLDMTDRRSRPSVTSVMGMAANIKFKTVSSFIKDAGVYHDITGEILKGSGYDVETVTPEKAAQNLYKLSRQNDFTLFEHFMTDIAGHTANMNEAVRVIEKLDCFLEELIGLMDFEEDVLIITSDHGNIEDSTVPTHTMNKVPVIILGKKAEAVNMHISSLVDIMPFVLKLFSQNIVC